MNQTELEMLLSFLSLNQQALNHFFNNLNRTDLTFFTARPRLQEVLRLIPLFAALTDEERMELLSVATTAARSRTTAGIALPITASQQQSVPRIMPSSGLNAEKLAGKHIDIPEEYCCSLSLSIMTDPVYLLNDPTGARFERDWITSWLSERGTHPISREGYSPGAIHPDAELKVRIDQFVQSAEAVTTNTLSRN